MQRYYYTDKDIIECNIILDNYYKTDKYLLSTIKLVQKQGYFLILSTPSRIILFMKHNPITYKISMTKSHDITCIELIKINTMDSIIGSIFQIVAGALFQMLTTILFLFYLFSKDYIQSFEFFLIMSILIFISIRILFEKSKFRDKANIEVCNFMKEKLMARDKI